MSKSFHNTINLEGKELEIANAKAATQETLIAAIFKANPGGKFSPSQIHSIMQIKYDLHPPLTSIRRGMTNLTMDKHMNVLTKLDEKIIGIFAMPEHLWILTGTTENIYKNGTQTAADIAIKIINGSKGNGNQVQGDLFLNL